MNLEKFVEVYQLPTRGRDQYLTDKLFTKLNFIWAKLDVCLSMSP